MRRAFAATLCALTVLGWLPGCTASPVAHEARSALPARVLFVGNSFTYYNDSLHNHLRRLMAAQDLELGRKPRIRIKTISGGRLVEHAGLDAMLASEPWDVVVLQGHSLEAYDEQQRDGFRQAVIAHDKKIRAAGARTALFMTWAYEDRPQMTSVIAQQYDLVGQQIGAQVVPVGLAFAAATQRHPDVALRHADMRHPTRAGTYLAACVFYAALFERSPAGLDYDAGLATDVAAALQALAWETVEGYSAN